MNRTLFTALALGITFVAASAHADDSIGGANYGPPAEAPSKPSDMPAQRLALHVAPALFVPVGNLADGTQTLGGGLVGIDYRLSSRATFTLRGGYMTALADQDQTIGGFHLKSSLDFAPVLGGVKWYLLEANEGLFFATEGGAIFAKGSSSVVGQAGNVPVNVAVSGSSTNFGAGGYIGLETGRWDFRAGVLTLDVGHPNNSTGVMATAALSFAQF